jgi:hypothetical protein
MMARRSALSIAVLIAAVQLQAQWNCSQLKYSGQLSANTVNVQLGGGWPPFTAGSLVGSAMDYWNGSCDANGTSHPYLCMNCGGTSSYPVVVNYVDGPAPHGRCGDHTAMMVGGLPAGSEINIYTSASGHSCSPMYDSLAHELGHVLGLEDVSANANCYGSIMGGRAPGGTRSVTASDCAAVNDAWETPTESRVSQCMSSCATSCDSGGYCENGGYVGYVGTPLILDLDDDGFTLTGKSDAVNFDLDADGLTDRVTWTSAGARDAFLVLDLDGDGSIASGAELFGDASALPNGATVSNGFDALAHYDTNRDGAISSADAVYASLRAWTDTNHDGLSQPGELLELAAAGVSSIETRYTTSNHRDEHGNLFRYRAKAQVRDKHGRVHSANTYDVLLQHR